MRRERKRDIVKSRRERKRKRRKRGSGGSKATKTDVTKDFWHFVSNWENEFRIHEML